jgi:Flp pilus assembly protein TadG
MGIQRGISWDSYRRRGTVAVLVALLLPLVVGTLALTLDGGLLYVQRRQAQSVADAAALAGAYQLYNGSNFSVAQSSAIAIGKQNGFTILSSQVTSPKAGYIAVSVAGSQPRFFSGLWGAGTMSAAASAVARGTTVAYSTAALLVLAPTGSSVTLSGTTQVTAVNGSIVVDSTSSSAILSSGSPSITAPVLDLSGNILYSGSNPNKATTTNYSQPNTPDPLAGISAPTTSGLTVQSTSAIDLSGTTSRTLNPGVYDGGIDLSGSSSITLNPGTYYINGSFDLSGSTGITGNGVFIYVTGGGTIDMSGTSSISLNPMTSGTYQGITMFQDRADTNGVTMSGGSNIDNSGTFYFPSATLNLSGSSGVAVFGSQFIVNKVAFSGTSGIEVDYNSSVASTSAFGLVQ